MKGETKKPRGCAPFLYILQTHGENVENGASSFRFALDSRPSPNSLDRNLLFILIIRLNNYYNLIVTHHYLPLLFMSQLNPFSSHMNENEP